MLKPQRGQFRYREAGRASITKSVVKTTPMSRDSRRGCCAALEFVGSVLRQPRPSQSTPAPRHSRRGVEIFPASQGSSPRRPNAEWADWHGLLSPGHHRRPDQRIGCIGAPALQPNRGQGHAPAPSGSRHASSSVPPSPHQLLTAAACGVRKARSESLGGQHESLLRCLGITGIARLQQRACSLPLTYTPTPAGSWSRNCIARRALGRSETEITPPPEGRR
jgi:hypothetical protein